MGKHKKPTQAELKKDIEKATKELEAPEKEVKPSEPAPSEPEPSEPAPSEPEPSEPAPSEPAPSEEVPEPTPSEPAPSPDYKKKFTQSSTEALKIRAKARRLNKAIGDAEEVPDPTEEELKDEFRDWDVMSNTEQRLAKEAVISKRYRQRISEARVEAKKIDKWSDDVEKFVEDPKTFVTYSELEGKQDEFKVFANEEENNSVPFKILVGAFLHEGSKGVKKKKGKMFEQGTGGPSTPHKSKGNKISMADARLLMKNDYKKYKKLLVAGKIDTSEVK